MISISMLEERLLSEWEGIKEVKKKKIIERDVYSKLKEYEKSKRIKIVIGPRRVGKSTLLISKIVDEKSYYVNFDDEILSSLKPEEYSILLTTLSKVFGKRKKIILDEIQNIPKWELFVNRLHRLGYDVYITGSNASLLKGEYATKLTGRTLKIELLPFSFNEFLKAKNEKPIFSEAGVGRILKYLEEYLIYGGFPEVIIEKSKKMKTEILKRNLEDILYKDILQRANIRNISLISSIAKTILRNSGSRISYRKLANSFGLSPTTISEYLSLFEEAYLIFSVSKFSFKEREKLSSIKKWFPYDTGFYTLVKKEGAKEFWRYLEIATALKLKRDEKEIYYYLVENRYEVDLLDDRKIYQITLDNELKERELRTAKKASLHLKLPYIIIGWYGKKTLPLYKFLLQNVQ